MAPHTPLLRPDRYFAEQEPSAKRAAQIVVLVTVVTAGAAFALGSVLAGKIDGTVLVDNPAYPGDGYCEGALPGGGVGCDQPARVERDIDQFLRDGANRLATQMLWVPAVAWVLVGVALHVPSWLAGGAGGAGRSFGIAGWGMAPVLVVAPLVVAVVALTFEPFTVTTATTPAAFETRLFDSLGPVETYGTPLEALSMLWSAVIWFFGLAVARDLGPGRAAAIAGGLALLLLAA